MRTLRLPNPGLFTAGLCLSLGAMFAAPAAAQASALWKSNHGGVVQYTTWSNTLSSLNSSGTPIDEMAISPSGEWIIVANDGEDIYHSPGIPALMISKIESYVAQGADLDTIVFAPNGSWSVVAGGLRWYSGGFPNLTAISGKVTEYINERGGVRDIAISSSGNGWIVVAEDNAFFSSNMGSALYSAAVDARKAGRQIREIEVASDGRWVLSTDNWFESSGLSSHSRDGLEVFQRNGWGLQQAALAPGGTFALYASGPRASGNTTLDQLEYTASGGNIFQLMSAANVPGVSVALLENGVITGVRAYGEAVGGEEEYAHASTRFIVASLSKPVVRSGMRALANIVQNGTPLLDLDADILTIRAARPGGQLDTWMDAVEGDPSAYGVSNANRFFPSGISTNDILSMSAGFPYTSAPVFIIPSTECSSAIRPQSWLRGYECNNTPPNDWPAIWPDGTAAGTYSSPSYTVPLAIAEDVYPGNGSYADVFRVVLFEPAGMERTTFDIDEINADSDVSRVHSNSGVPAPATAIRTAIGGGSLYSTARDQVSYLQYLDTGALGPTSGTSSATGSTTGNGYTNYSRWRMNWNSGNGIAVLTNGNGDDLAAALITRFAELKP